MRTAALVFALAAGLTAAATPALARPFLVLPAQPARTDSPAARCARDFMTMINDPTPERVKAFETTWASKDRLTKTPIDERVTRLKGMQEEWGKTTVTDFSESKDHAVTVSATTANGHSLELSFNMSSTEKNKLDSIEIQASSDGAAAHAQALTAEARTQTVEGVAAALRKGYVFPDKGDKMADFILAKLKTGAYGDIEKETELAKQLTDDCRSVTHDKHLGIRFAPEEKSASHEGQSSLMPSRDEMRRENYAFKKVEILAGNIGLLRFDAFVQDDDANRVASNAMNFLSGCDAIIFDIRANGGGSPEMIRYITSYLFTEKTHLNDMVDREGKIVEEFWTLPEVPGPRPKANIPVYVLTSSRTFSGAEEFSYNLKNLKRATLVGETTGGGAHPVRADRVNDRFIVRVPYMRAQNPISKTNWEGTGVEPDVKTPAADALDKALELAREASHAKK